MSSSSHLIMDCPPSDSSSTMEAAEKAQDIIEDLSGDDYSTDNVQTNNTENGQTNDADDDNGQHSKLTEFHAKNYHKHRELSAPGSQVTTPPVWKTFDTRFLFTSTRKNLFTRTKST